MATQTEALKLYFLIAPALYLVNTLIATAFAIKYKKDAIYKKSAAIWLAYLATGITQGVIQDNENLMFKTVVWSVTCFAGAFFMSLFISDILKINNNHKKDILLFMSAIAFALLLYSIGTDINLAALVCTFFAAFPMLKHVGQLKNFKYVNFTKTGTLVCFLLISLHMVDYAYAVDKPELQFYGYLVALMLATAASCFTFASLVERVILEIEVRELLQNTSRLIALGGMAAEISHEIKNPLTVLSLNNMQVRNKLMQQKDGFFDTNYFLNKLDVADKMLKRLNEILNTLKSHYNSGQSEGFKLSKLKSMFDEVSIICDIKAKKLGVAVEFLCHDDEFQIECRSVQVTQAIQNLIQNSLDELENVPNARVQIKSEIINEGRFIKIFVLDNGRGVPAEVQPYIFDSFFTTKQSDKGSGLGLSISKRFIEDHQGRLYLESSRPGSTCFVIILPCEQKFANNSQTGQKAS